MAPATPECIDVAGQVLSALSYRHGQHSAEQQSEAAGEHLLQLLSDCGGFAVTSRAAVLQLMSKPIQTRQEYIRQEAQRRSVRYTAGESQQCLSDWELSEKDMQDALAFWQAQFLVEDMLPNPRASVVDRMCCCHSLLKASGMATAMSRRVIAWHAATIHILLLPRAPCIGADRRFLCVVSFASPP